MKKEIIVKLTYDEAETTQDDVFELLDTGLKDEFLTDWEIQNDI